MGDSTRGEKSFVLVEVWLLVWESWDMMNQLLNQRQRRLTLKVAARTASMKDAQSGGTGVRRHTDRPKSIVGVSDVHSGGNGLRSGRLVYVGGGQYSMVIKSSGHAQRVVEGKQARRRNIDDILGDYR